MNKQELYKSNQRKIKAVGFLTPIVFWVCIALGVVLLVAAISQTMANIDEIYNLLDSQVYNDTEIAENYQYLIDKYGEWVIGKGTNGFTMHFINFKGAIFNGINVALVVCGEIFIVGGIMLGKWILPALKKKIENENQDMVNLTILEKADEE